MEDERRSHSRPRESEPPKLYLSNLPNSVKEEDLKEFFNEFGRVEVNIKSKMSTAFYAFITFETKELAQKALETKNNQQLLGREIRL
jgi:RNA recognition motif-containing protein